MRFFELARFVFQKCEQHSGLIIMGLTLVIAFTGTVYTICSIAYAFIAAGQWSAMVDSNKTNREALVSVQRAFVFLDNFTLTLDYSKDGKHVIGTTVKANWRNTGTTPALESRYWINHQYDSLTDMFPDFDEHGSPIGDAYDRVHPAYFAPQSSGGLSGDFYVPLESISNHRPLWVYGWIRYRDVFDETTEHVTKFSYSVEWVYFPTEAKDTRQPVVRISMTKQHNCIDGQCNAKK